jgi:DoxX-like family
MHTAAVILEVVLALVFLLAGGVKVAGAKQSLQIRDSLGVDARLWTIVGALEVAGALGLLAAFVVPALGIAAAVGLSLLLIGAVVAHGRANDLRGSAPALILLIVSVATIVVQVKSL